MRYDFDEIIDRRGSSCVKWDECDDADMLPLWVADMDFRAAPPIMEALRRRMEHGVFGYVDVPRSFYDAVIGWFARRHCLEVQREEILYTSGVVPAISAIIKAMSMPGDNVLVLTPVYNCFYSSIRNCGCQADEVPLVREGDSYVIDFEEMERHAANPKTTVFLLCNPHNPVGRVWTADELRRMAEICERHDVYVISDEIHGEIVFPMVSGGSYHPFRKVCGNVNVRCATCVSPSKAFNIAGLQIACILADERSGHTRIDRWLNIHEVCDVNPFGVVAAEAAYNEGEEWLEQLNAYIYDNYTYACDVLKEQMPQLEVLRQEGTYLMWVGIKACGMTSDVLCDRLREEAHVWFASGTTYGAAGEGYIRINLACTRKTLAEALDRFAAFLRRQE